MSLSIGNLGWWSPTSKVSSRPNRVVLPTSTGTTIVVVAEANSSDAPAAYGSHDNQHKLRVFEINAAYTVVTEVASVNLSAIDAPFEKISADLYEDNSVGVAYLLASGTLGYRKFTYGTWAVSAAETVATVVGVVQNVDISISQADVPCVTWLEKNAANPKLVLKANTRRTSDSTWVNSTTQTIVSSSDPNHAMAGVSVAWAKAGAADTRPLMIAVDSALDSGADNGVKIFSAVVNEASGALVNWTLRKTYLAGNQTTKWTYTARRTYLFRSGDGEITIVHMEAVDKKNLMIARCTWDGNTWAETMAPQISTAGLGTIDYTAKFAASYANDTVNFYFMAPFGSVMSPVNYIGVINRAAGSVRFSGPFKWDNLSTTSDHWWPMAGTGKFANVATNHRMAFFGKAANGGWVAKTHNVKAAPAPTAVTPGDGSTTLTGTPALSMRASLGKQWPQSNHKAVWQFALDSSFTTSVKTYTQDDTKFVKIENTQTPGSYLYIADTLPAELSLSSGNWFVRGALVDEFGIQGAWSSVNTVALSHPPMAAELSPNSGTYIAAGNVSFTWTFTDPLAGDVQTAYQVIVERNDDGTVVYDSGKLASGSHGHLANIVTTGTLLRWRVQLWDSDDVSGGYSDYVTFAVAGPPSVVVDAPTPAAVVTSGTPAILFTPTVDGGRRIKAYQVIVKQAGEVVKNSGTVAVDVASGTQLTWRVPSPLLTDGGGYSVQVYVTDETVMTASSPEVAFSIDIVEPLSSSDLNAVTTHYNVEGEGWIEVTWTDNNRDADFEAWVIERKDDLLGQGMTVVDEGEYIEIGRVTETGAAYLYKDFYAPSGYKSTYKVRQLVNRGGDRAISVADDVAFPTYPNSEGYWIIEPASETGETISFRLSNVTDDSYSPEWEETEYTIIGRGRHVDKGDFLGVKGALTAKLRDTSASTARQKKLQLEAARDTDSEVFLRNPFGDVWPVSIGNLSISRLAGVGKSEFVDVTVPYSQVAP